MSTYFGLSRPPSRLRRKFGVPSHEKRGDTCQDSSRALQSQLLSDIIINLQFDIPRFTHQRAKISSWAPTSSLPGLAFGISGEETKRSSRSLINTACPYLKRKTKYCPVTWL